ncbi:MAG: Penicillin-binding protein beta-lactamase class [Caulobacter sp.]|nr:Penicillin-binding protein beta-lactamase class [Caulobacter sp.]
MRRVLSGMLAAVLGVAAPAVGWSLAAPASAEAPAAPLPAAVMDRVKGYIATVNGGDAAAVAAFRERDSAASANAAVPAGPFLGFFSNQKRVTGGFTLVGARMKAGAPNIVEVAVRDHIYGGLHGVELTLEDTPERKITLLDPGPAPAWAEAGGPLRGPGEVGARTRAVVARGCKAGVFSGAVLVARGDRVVMQTACGEASRRFHVKNGLETKFNLGSINKMFTAVAVMQLVEAGKVSLSDPLSRYVDETWLPTAVASRITLGQLMNHTSGLGSFLNREMDRAPRNAYRQLDDFKPLVRTETLAFAPGTGFQYSNTGMLLLGIVIEKASGEPYLDYIRRHIYGPAGMIATDCYAVDEPVPDVAIGYTPDPASPYGWREALFTNLYRGGPAGGGYSTVGDMFRFARALQAGRLVSPASLKVLWTDNPPNNYGAGFETRQTPAGKVVGHTGFYVGVSSRLSLFLDRDYVVVVLSNVEVGAPTLMDVLTDEVARAG